MESYLQASLELVLSLPWLRIEHKGTVMLEEAGGLRLVAHVGVSRDLPTRCAWVRAGECVCGKVALTKQVCQTTGVDDRHDIHLDGEGDHGHVTLPLLWKERLLGVFNTYVEAGFVAGREELQFLVGRRIVLEQANWPEPLLTPMSKAQLEQVVFHLVNNAVDALMGKGKITIEWAENGAFAALVVADDGPGIALELREKVFDPSFTTKASHKGSGVGLHTVREVVVASGGSVTIDPQHTLGTRVVVQIPVMNP